MSLLEHFENIKHTKGLMFINAHIPVARYLDSLEDPSDEHINISVLCNLYKPLGKSRFDADRNLIKLDGNLLGIYRRSAGKNATSPPSHGKARCQPGRPLAGRSYRKVGFGFLLQHINIAGHAVSTFTRQVA